MTVFNKVSTPKLLWRKRDGKRIPLANIVNKHLMNILRVLERATDATTKRKFPPQRLLVAEATRRGLIGR